MKINCLHCLHCLHSRFTFLSRDGFETRPYLFSPLSVLSILVPIIPILLLVAPIFQAFAGENEEVGTTYASFLKIGVGARPIAMGEAYVAMSGDVNSIYWNPASLGEITGSQISLTHTEWFADMRYEWIGVAQHLNQWLTLGASASLLHSGEIPRTVESEGSISGYETDGVFRFANSSYGLAIGSGIYKNVRFGASVQVLRQSLSFSEAKRLGTSDLSSQSAIISLGGFYQTPIPKLQLGASLQNLGSNGGGFLGEEQGPIPARLKLGVAYLLQVGSEIETETGIEGNFNKLLLAMDLSIPSDTSPKIHLGSEYSLKNGISIRGGYRSGSGFDFVSSFSGGIGYKTDSYELDYAFVPFGDIGLTHRVSFTLLL